VDRVLIPTTVTDSFGRPVQGLQRRDFRILQDGVEQELSHFNIEDGPVSIGVGFDFIGSIRTQVPAGPPVINKILQYGAHNDEYCLVTFKDEPQLVRGFTRNVEEIEADLSVGNPEGWTALYDAMFLAINHMKRASLPRRALLVLSDGGDNNSRY